MNISNLWEDLSKYSQINESFIKDQGDGKVPELPFCIIGQQDLKKKLSTKINSIDDPRMQTLIVSASYGNGKTNLFKYLEFYFKTVCVDTGIHVLNYRADPENVDIILFLLKIIVPHFKEDLVRGVIDIRNNKHDIAKLAGGFQNNFLSIQEYTSKLFEDDLLEDDIVFLLQMGSGKLYNKKYFDSKKISQLTDYNRREILVLFLNILAYKKIYLILCIDEVEKIREKSKTRFSHFLTSYRELTDLFNKINGHLLIAAITPVINLEEESTPFYSRISMDIVKIEPAYDKKEEILGIIDYLKRIFNKIEIDSNTILRRVLKHPFVKRDNRELIQFISGLLLNTNDTVDSWDVKIKKLGIEEKYEFAKADLEAEGAFVFIHRKMFDPLEYYINSITLGKVKMKKQNRYYFNEDTDKVYYFIFNENPENIPSEIYNLEAISKEEAPKDGFVIFSPSKLELKNSIISEILSNVTVLDYEPAELFTLLELYRENYDLQDVLKEIIGIYTKNEL